VKPVIRQASPEDDLDVGELLVDAFVQAYAEKMPAVVVDDNRKRLLLDVRAKRAIATVLVAELEGRVVGTVALFKPGAESSEAWLPNHADLRHLATDRKLHGKGLSDPLLAEAERIARESWKVDGICLHVRRGAFGVAKLYMKRGYVRTPSGDIDRLPLIYLEGYVLQCSS
jgi:predicted N-acetyltransferase YhbS